MSTEVGSARGVVLSLQAYRDGERRPAMIRMGEGVPTSAYEDAISSAKFAEAPGRRNLSLWAGELPDFESISSAHAAAPGAYDLDSRRFEAAKATIGTGLNEFRSFVSRYELLLIQHAAYMVGFKGSYNDMHAAHQRGELTPLNFRSDVAASPYKDELLAGLIAFQIGIESPHDEIVCDSIVLGAKTLANLSFMSEHPEVSAGAGAIIAAANEFPDNCEKPQFCNKVMDAMSTLASAVPSLQNSINLSAFQFSAGKMLGSL